MSSSSGKSCMNLFQVGVKSGPFGFPSLKSYGIIAESFMASSVRAMSGTEVGHGIPGAV